MPDPPFTLIIGRNFNRETDGTKFLRIKLKLYRFGWGFFCFQFPNNFSLGFNLISNIIVRFGHSDDILWKRTHNYSKSTHESRRRAPHLLIALMTRNACNVASFTKKKSFRSISSRSRKVLENGGNDIPTFFTLNNVEKYLMTSSAAEGSRFTNHHFMCPSAFNS